MAKEKTIIEQCYKKAYEYDDKHCVRSSRLLFAENSVKEALRLFAEKIEEKSIVERIGTKRCGETINMIIDIIEWKQLKKQEGIE